MLYSLGLTLEVTDYVFSCRVCQQENSVHRLTAELLEPPTLLEQKWTDVSMGFVVGLLISDKGHDGILTVVDTAIKRVHLAPVQQTIAISEVVLVH